MSFKIKYTRLMVFAVLIELFLPHCKKIVEVPQPKNVINTATVFTTDANASSTVAGIYSTMSTLAGSGFGLNVYGGLCADELTNYSSGANTIQFYQNGILPTNSDLNSSFWSAYYQLIFAANSIMDGLNNSNSVSAPVKKQLMGEAKFIRAFCHFYLVNLFGAVPIVTTTDYKINAVIKRSSVDSVYAQIVSDLKVAKSLLASDYSFSHGEKVRPNQGVASALLARVYLYMRDWQHAQEEASLIISNTTDYSLAPNLNNVFLANSSEAIWQLIPVGGGTAEASTFILSGAPNLAAISDQLLSAFEVGDLRRANWIDSVNADKWYYYPFKYKVISDPNLPEYSMVLRLAEQYLIRAEARAQLDDTDGAAGDLNVIRNRAGLFNTAATTKEDLLAAISHEHQTELFTEMADRWLDLKHTGNVNSIMNGVTTQKGGSWKPGYQLWPIPQVQLQNDPNMAHDQNPDY